MIIALFFGSANVNMSTAIRVLEAKLFKIDVPALKKSAIAIIWDSPSWGASGIGFLPALVSFCLSRITALLLLR